MATFLEKLSTAGSVSRVNGLIAEQEKRINETYFHMGKMYFAKHSNDYESEFSDMFAAISDANQKIAVYKKQVCELKGLVQCENCGAYVPNTVAFCSTCGGRIKSFVTPGPDSVICQNCGSFVDKNMRFCTKCGNPMTTAATPAQAPVPPTAPMDEQVNPVPETEPLSEQYTVPLSDSTKDMPIDPAPVLATEPVTEQAESFKYCTNCGIQVPVEAVFCTGCGSKL